MTWYCRLRYLSMSVRERDCVQRASVCARTYLSACVCFVLVMLKGRSTGPTFGGPWGPYGWFSSGKKFSPALPAKIFFRFTVEFGGPWGSLPLPSRGPRAPYFYPEGAHGAPYGCVPSRKKFFAGTAGEHFFPLHGRVLAICFFTFI